MAGEDPSEAMARVWANLDIFNRQLDRRDGPQFDGDIMQRVRPVYANIDGTTTFELDVGMEYSNAGGTMHGGAAALILDQFTTSTFMPVAPVKRKPGKFDPPGGLSRALNITYLRPLFLPATIRIESKIIHSGRTMSLVRGNITSKDGSKIYFTCDHHKIRVPDGQKISLATNQNQKSTPKL